MQLISVDVAAAPKPTPVSLADFEQWAKIPSIASDTTSAQAALDSAVYDAEKITKKLFSGRQVTEVWEGYGKIKLSYVPNGAVQGSQHGPHAQDQPTLVDLESWNGYAELPYNSIWQITYQSGADIPEAHHAIMQLALTYYNDREDHSTSSLSRLATSARKQLLRFRRY